MELNLQKQTITINDTVFDGAVEQPVECDAQLPDYCPDIQKILKCAVSANILSTHVSGNRLTIEGITFIKVYYLPEGGGLRKADYKTPFTKVMELRSAPEHSVVTATPSVDYINCRAVNQRRVDVRGALTLHVKVSDRRATEVVGSAEGAGLQLKSELIQSTELQNRSENCFNIQEELELGYGKPPVGTVIRNSCVVNVLDYKIVSGKVVTKGEVLLQVSYLPSDRNNHLEVMEYTLPISQIIDCEGIDEQCVCEIDMTVDSCDIQPKADEAGEYRTFQFDARICAVVSSWRQREIPIAADCYSTQYDCSSKQVAVPFLRLEKILSEMINHKSGLALPEGMDEVLDLWCEIDKLDWKYSEEHIALSLQITVCMFAKMAEDESCSYFEQPLDMTESIPVSCMADTLRFDPNVDITACSWNPSGSGEIELRMDICVRGCVFCTFRQSSISEIEVNENSPKHKEKNKLYLYYADSGESVWDIAKHYNTSTEAIWEENAVESDILRGKCLLLIPIV